MTIVVPGDGGGGGGNATQLQGEPISATPPLTEQALVFNGTEYVPETVVRSVVAGTNITVDDTDPANPVVNATAGGTGVSQVTNTDTFIAVTDPTGPIVTLGEGAGLTAALAAKAALASPTFTGVPAAPTAAAGTSTTQLANTAFVTGGIATAVTGLATTASPTFTGTPAAPTAAPGTNTTQLATTAFVTGGIATAVTGLATTASPTFTGVPAAPTAAPGTNTTQLATTAFVTAAVGSPALTHVSGHLLANYNLTAALATFMTTASLAVGTWLVSMTALIAQVGSLDNVEGKVNVGTATATFDGTLSFQKDNSGTTDNNSVSISFIVVVTVAGTLIFQAIQASATGTIDATTGGNSYANATGYTAVKIG